jgi:sugar transferase (PEP-CTERM/EpsH1 system associated)
LAFCDNPDEIRYAKELQEYCKTVVLMPLSRWKQCLRAGFAMLCGKPWSLGYFSEPRMKKEVADRLARLSFDLIFVYCSSMAAYAVEARIPKMLDFVDSDSLKWRKYAEFRRPPQSWLYGYEARKLSSYELEMIEEFDLTLFVSRMEVMGRSIEELDRKVVFMQNGIDLEFFKPPSVRGNEPTIAFTGAMDYYPNIDAALYFAHEIFPRVRSVYPNARFIIIGSNPAVEVQKLASVPGITVTGTVEDVRPFLAQCQAAVVPLRIAQGIQNKILEALAFGLPVVTTPVAAGALAAEKGLPIAVAANPEEFAHKVTQYIRNAPLSPGEIDTCRQHLKMQYDWDTNLAVLDQLINGLV